jgi:hypothetical protein
MKFSDQVNVDELERIIIETQLNLPTLEVKQSLESLSENEDK